MAIEFISGKPSNGKSLRAMMLLEQELRVTRRNVVTNLAVRPGDLAEKLNEIYGDCFDMNKRLRILTPEETMCFWFFPAVGVDLDPKKKKEWTGADGSKLVVPDLDKIQELGGTLFIIDEAHVFFGSRQWQTNKESKEGGFYFLSQHAKMKSDIILVTQHVERVDNQFRSVSQSYIYMENRSMRNIPILGGLVRNIAGFTQRKYPEPFRTGMHSEETVRLKTADKLWLANCYDTTAGVGITSRGDGRADKKPKGLPFFTLAIPVIALIAAIWFIPDYFMKAAAGKAMTAGAQNHNLTPPAPAAPGQTAASRLSEFVGHAPKKIESSAKPQVAKSQVWISGWIPTPDKKEFIIYLSDGRSIRRGYRFLDESTIEFQGEVFSTQSAPLLSQR